MFILNLGSGKLDAKKLTCSYSMKTNIFQVSVDRSYKNENIIESIELSHFASACSNLKTGFESYNISCDIFEFLDTYKYKFDHIIAERICEHLFYDSGEIGRFLDACNQITNDTATMEILVPNFEKLIFTYQDFKERFECKTAVDSSDINSKVLLLNCEMTNSRCDPHGSVWSRDLAKFYIEQEKTWQINKFEDEPSFKCRDCYMRIYLTK